MNEKFTQKLKSKKINKKNWREREREGEREKVGINYT